MAVSRDYMRRVHQRPRVRREAASTPGEAEAQTKPLPENPQRDVLQFLIEHAPLEDWELEILNMVRDRGVLLCAAGPDQDHERGLGQLLALDDHDDAGAPRSRDHRLRGPPLGHDGHPAWQGEPVQAGHRAVSRHRRPLEQGALRQGVGGVRRPAQPARKWDKKLGAGREKIFEVRKHYNDVTFIDAFLTPEFAIEQKLFVFNFNDKKNSWEIATREFKKVKAKLLQSLTNFGQPVIDVLDANHDNRGELMLSHRYDGVDLDPGYAKETLKNLHHLWKRPVGIMTRAEGKGLLMRHDGATYSEKKADL
jgi:stage V sporulation protein R